MSGMEVKENENSDLDTSNDVNGGKSEYFCPVCNEDFKDDISLTVHGLLHVENGYCTICKRQYTYTHKSFRNHVEKKHLNMVCNICGKVYLQKNSLKIHLKTHGAQFKCKKCDKTFKQKFGLETHTSYAHEGFRLICEMCNGHFATKSSLSRHIKNVHSKNIIFRCKICLEEFKGRKALINHGNSHILSPKECYVCGREFKKIRNLKYHLSRMHVKQKKCPYPYCNGQFHKSVLQRHVDKVHSTKACNECGKMFLNKKVLFQHIKKHTKPTNGTIYYCTYCPKTSSTMIKLIQHSREQHKKRIKMFQCKVCSKKFTKVTELNKHYINHGVYRPFGCDVCLKRFKHNLHLKRHIKRVHDKIKFKCETCCILFRKQKFFESHKCLGENISCRICNVKCKTKAQMHKHLINIHSPITGCSVTCKMYQLNKFKKANVIREGKFRYQCTKCFKRYSILQTFKKHICITLVKLGHSPTFRCKLCGLLSPRKEAIQRHFSTKHVAEFKSEENQFIESDLLEIKNEYIDVNTEGHQIFVNPLEVKNETYSDFSIKTVDDDSDSVFGGTKNNFCFIKSEVSD